MKRRAILGVLGLTVAVGLGAAVPASAMANAHSDAGSAAASAQLVREYLAALTPAGTAIPQTEAALKKLGASSNSAQVESAVAPLRAALAPLEALLASPGPPTSLEVLGAPTKQGCFKGAGSYQGYYRTVAQGAHLDVGGRLYESGFQVSIGCSAYNMLTWPLRDKYKELSAQFGQDAVDCGRPLTLSFRDSTNTPIPFTYHGKLGFAVGIPLGALIPVTVNVAHESDVTIVLSGGTNGGVVDVVSDRLS